MDADSPEVELVAIANALSSIRLACAGLGLLGLGLTALVVLSFASAGLIAPSSVERWVFVGLVAAVALFVGAPSCLLVAVASLRDPVRQARVLTVFWWLVALAALATSALTLLGGSMLAGLVSA